MARILTISGSPQYPSRTEGVLSYVNRRLVGRGHEVETLHLRELPAGPLLAADTTDPEIAAAVARVVAADAVVIGSPVYKAAYSGLLKTFLDLLPQFALSGKALLPVVTGGSAAHVLAVDYALRPVLASMNPAHIGPGWFVAASQVTLFPDGGVLVDPLAARPLDDVVDAFVTTVELLGTAHRAASAPGRASVATAEIVVTDARVTDPAAAPLLADLSVEYSTRYGRDAVAEFERFPAAEFTAPDGSFVLLSQDGETVAGGAIRRYDADTAEIKRVWTSPRHRRQGLGRRVLAELERRAADLGYRRLVLTTGPRQPEAAGLYLSAGYVAHYDRGLDPEAVGRHPFSKELAPDTAESRWATDLVGQAS